MKRNLRLATLALVLSIGAAVFSISCGGGGSGGGIVTLPPTLNSITVTATSPSVVVGQTDQLTATGTYSDGSTQNLTNSSTWSSADATIATVSSSGNAKGVAAGSVKITATSGAISGSVTISVVNILAVSVIVSPTTIVTGGTANVSITVNGGSGHASVSLAATAGTLSPTTGLASTYTAPASVPNPATVTITATATDGSQTAQGSATATVVVPPLTSITVTATSPSVVVGQTDQLTATGTYSDGSTQNLTNSSTWSSADATIATVSSSGNAKGVAAGSVKITATSGAISGSVSISVVPPPPTITSVTTVCTPASIVVGATSQCAATVTGTWNYSSAVSWQSSNPAVGTIDQTGKVTGIAAGNAMITATSTEDTSKSGSAPVTVTMPLVVTVSGPSSVNAGATTQFQAVVSGGIGNPSYAWAVNGIAGGNSAVGTISAGGLYAAPSGITSNMTATVTVTVTEGTSSAQASAQIAVNRVITLAIQSPNIPNNELQSDWRVLFNIIMTCAGCQPTDTLHAWNNSNDADSTTPFSQLGTPWLEVINATGYLYVPRLNKLWITGTDGAVSNVIFLVFGGSQNGAVQDPATGEIYYPDDGNETQGSGTTLKFKPGGTTDGNIAAGGMTIAIGGQTIFGTQSFPIASGINGIAMVNTDGSGSNLIPLTNGEPLAIAATRGLVCVTISTGGPSPNATDAVDCNGSNGTFTIAVPSGSQPATIAVLDASNIVEFGRGDQTLRWFTVSGSTGTAAGTLQLQEFTAASTTYWGTYPWTEGWHCVVVGSMIGVMGEVVNGDGTVSQKLALVTLNSTTKTLVLNQYVGLPPGTLRIAADITNTAIAAAYPDLSGATPQTRFVRVYAYTGNIVNLASTSSLVPPVDLLVTQDGNHIAVFGMGQYDFELNW